MKQYYLYFYLDINCSIKYEIHNIYANSPADAIRKIPFSPLYNVYIKELLTGNITTYGKVVNINKGEKNENW